jgi:hypothetical protein
VQTSSKRKRSIVRYFAIAGFLVPLTFLIANWIAFSIDRYHIPWTVTHQYYVWPSSIIVMATQENFSISTLIILSVSIGVNVLLYTTIGLFVKGIAVAWRRVFKSA